jgi:hypothetical protein
VTAGCGKRRPAEKAWRQGDACIIAYFRLTPKSSKEAIDGVIETPDGPAFQARVRALPEDGAANTALEELAAEWLGVPKRSVSLATGGKSRLKSLRISGVPNALEGLLQERTSEFKK